MCGLGRQPEVRVRKDFVTGPAIQQDGALGGLSGVTGMWPGVEGKVLQCVDNNWTAPEVLSTHTPEMENSRLLRLLNLASQNNIALKRPGFWQMSLRLEF